MNEFSVEEEMRTFIHNLVWLKNHNGFSKEKMAEILEISIEIWEKVENEKIPTSLTGEVFYIIKEYFDINPSDMIYKNLSDEFASL